MWGWWGFLLFFYFYIFYILVVRARRGKHSCLSIRDWFIISEFNMNKAAANQPGHITSLYDLILFLTWLFIFPYLIVLTLGDGSGDIKYVLSLSFIE
jgi:hypothetical protein